MSTELNAAAEFFIEVFTELAVLFIAISFVVSYINQKLPPEKVKSMLSGNRGYGVAVGLGAVTPFCSCSTLPMTIGLIQARAAFGPIMAFLFTSPLLNPFLVGLFWVSFGAKVTLIYSTFVVVLASVSGMLLQNLNFERFIREDIRSPACSANNAATQDQSSSNPVVWGKLLKATVKQFFSFAPYMAIGVSVGAFLHGYVPQNAFETLGQLHVVLLIPVAALVGILLYIRASTMVPIASSLAAKGLSMGAIMSLTIAGAGASLPEMIMMKRMFHWPLITAFVALVFSTACITGFAIDLL